MKGFLFSLGLLLSFAGFSQKLKSFPEFSYTSAEGQTFSNKNLEGKNSIIILFHLGCPAAMYLLKDLENFNLAKNTDFQYIGILENTNEDIREFNANEKSKWSDIRTYFNMPPSTIPLLGECDHENISIRDQGKKKNDVRCRKLAKKLKTKSSPTLYFVNPEGQITKVKKGYLTPASTEEVRKAYLEF